MKIFLSFIIVAIFFSCNSGKSGPGPLQHVDNVLVRFFTKTDTLQFSTAKKGQVELLAETVLDAGTQTGLLQDTTGSMRFTQKDSLVLEVFFSTPGTGSKFDAPVYAYEKDGQVYGGRFTYKAGSLLEDFFHNLRSKRK